MTESKPMTMIRNFVRNRRGAAAIEFALVANLFVALLLGSFAVGYVFVVRSDLEQSITAAERFALINEEDDAELTDIIRDKLATYDGSKIALTLTRASQDGVDYVKADLSYVIDLGIDFIVGPVSITSSRVFPT
jgi:Flp pilus assembly protein TadG